MRKGQAAMEFLMTYGWAILVVLAAIGALAYFGVLSPDRFLPDKCTASPPFSCVEYKVSEGSEGGTQGQVRIFLQNSAGVDVYMNGVYISCDGGTTEEPTAATNSAEVNQTPPVLTYNGNTATANWTSLRLAAINDCEVVEGAKFSATYVIDYTKSGESVSHQATGSIQVRAEA